jgi:hypothetical protein
MLNPEASQSDFDTMIFGKPEESATTTEEKMAREFLKRGNFLSPADEELFGKLLDAAESGANVQFTPREVQRIKKYANEQREDTRAMETKIMDKEKLILGNDHTELLLDDDDLFKEIDGPVSSAPPITRSAPPVMDVLARIADERAVVSGRTKVWLDEQLNGLYPKGDSKVREPLTLEEKIALVEGWKVGAGL